jgi:spore coat polysaccharide biosynthesis predicted glycosyltransferase SpsG
MNIGTFVFRVDASENIGTGHLTRCLFIAKFIKSKGWNVVFLTEQDVSKQIIIKEGFQCRKVEEKYSSVASCFQKLEKPIIVLADINCQAIFNNKDKYTTYLQSLNGDSELLVIFEDLIDYPYSADIVIIPYCGADKLKLNENNKTNYLLGSKYFPLREEFKNNDFFVSKEAKKILITMGGSDTEKITLRVLRSLNQLSIKCEITVVIGRMSRITNHEVEDSLLDYQEALTVVHNAANMSELIQNSDIVITNSGLTKYEVSSLGVPLILISNNKLQALYSEEFANFGSSIHLGECNMIDEKIIGRACINLMRDYKVRLCMSKKGKILIDGNGIARIYRTIKDKMLSIESKTMMK